MINQRKNFLARSNAILAAGLFGIISLFVISIFGEPDPDADGLFATSDNCQSCHNNLGVENGEDLSIGHTWRSTMMAHSAVDPYWLAGVRRETIDHPSVADAIEDECAKCHKPMQRLANREMGLAGRVFEGDELGVEENHGANSPLAIDGVSCTICHQITSGNLGTEESFVGGFIIETTPSENGRIVYGPFDIAKATRRVMLSATGFEPARGDHIKGPELCATCHTLYTHSLDEEGNDLGKFPEQVPYLEWQHSVYEEGGTTCQDCHMATSNRDNPISSVLGKPRSPFSKHSFRGGNFLLPGLMGQHADLVGARATAQELDVGIRKTRAHLEELAAKIEIDPQRTEIVDGVLRAEVTAKNLAGHKLPTAYPSRRVWIQFVVKDAKNKTVFVSGALNDDGSIHQNDNDLNKNDYEPHYNIINDQAQVQIYESIMGRPNGSVTTGLLEASQYLKDNRILPDGFDKEKALPDVAVRGAASGDENFAGGSHKTTYSIDVSDASGPFTITALLWYQPVGFRWAMNLAEYEESEPQTFVSMYSSLAGSDTAIVLARDVLVVKEDLPITYPEPLPAELIPRPN